MVEFSELLSVAQSLYQHIETVKTNQAQCEWLKERVSLLLQHLESSDALQKNEVHDLHLKVLKQVITDAVALTGKFQEEQYYKRFLFAGTWKDELVSLHQRLTDCIRSFNLGLKLQRLIDDEADRAAILKDMDTLRDQIAAALSDNQHTRDELAAITKAIMVLSGETKQNQQMLNQLASRLEEASQNAPTTEIVVVDDGATVNDLIHRYVDKEFQFVMPKGTSKEEMDLAKSFATDLHQATSQNSGRTTITVVKKGGHVDKLIEETKDFLLGFSYTPTSVQYGDNPPGLSKPPTTLPSAKSPAEWSKRPGASQTPKRAFTTWRSPINEGRVTEGAAVGARSSIFPNSSQFLPPVAAVTVKKAASVLLKLGPR